MAPIRTHEVVFLGIVVNPKTSAPIFVQRKANSQMTVQIMGLGQTSAPVGGREERVYTILGDGYLNDDKEYSGPTDVTGYPRSHTPHGVTEKGGGYGTALYTGLVLLAAAHDNEEIVIPGLLGKGAGICSDEDTRSDAATRWWRKSLARKLTEQMSGDTEGEAAETETETIDDEDVSEYVSSRDFRRLEDAVRDAVSNHGDWNARNVSIRADMEREVESDRRRGAEHITADFYTLVSAVKHGLVACTETSRGTIMDWARQPKFEGAAHKAAILALNVAGEDTLIVAKLAMLAQSKGATEYEVSEMMIRNHFGVDIVSRKLLFDAGEQLGLPVVYPPRLGDQVGGRRKRTPPRRERGTTDDPKKNPPHVVIRRNPTPSPTPGEFKQLERSLRDLEKRREDLGWNELADLP